MSFTEIHFHFLPGVDDGPSTLDESIEVARAAAADGTATLIATPHVNRTFRVDVRAIAGAVHELRAELARERVPVEVRPGGELSYRRVERLDQDELELIAQGPDGRRWLLLEPAFGGMDEGYTEAADELRDRGFAVVVAHPERVRPSAKTSGAIADELRAGSVLQLTAGSFTGEYGETVRARAWELLRRAPPGRVAIASDAHSLERPPSLRAAIEAIRSGGYRDAEGLAAAVPQSLLERGLAVPPAARAA